MARIRLGKLLASAIYGGVDIGLEELDKYRGWTEPFKKSTDIARAVVAIGSGIANYLGIEEDLSEALFYSSLPLLEKSVYVAVRRAVGMSSSSERRTITASQAGFRRIVQETPVVQRMTGTPAPGTSTLISY